MGFLDGLFGGGSDENKVEMPDVEITGIHKPSYDDYNDRKMRGYDKYLSNLLSENGRPTTMAYRQNAYDRIAGTTRAAEDAIRENSAQAYGANNPSGMTGALIAATRAKAPYAQADMAAREAGRQAALQAGQALMARKQNQANWYTTLISPYLHEKDTEAGLAVGAANASAATAGADSASSGAAVGAIGSIVAALITAL